jgi:hypothetical protein
MDEQMYANEPMSGTQPQANSGYKIRKQELLREHEVRIRFLSVGCVVSVGCKDIPFRDVNEAMEEINKYVNNPYEEEKRWRKIFENEL